MLIVEKLLLQSTVSTLNAAHNEDNNCYHNSDDAKDPWEYLVAVIFRRISVLIIIEFAHSIGAFIEVALSAEIAWKTLTFSNSYVITILAVVTYLI